VEDSELVDPMLAPERLLYRLFHEERIRAFKSRSLTFHCGCSADSVKAMLGSFAADELQGMAEDGQIHVTCEFCNTRYDFDPRDFG
ncbi:MAG: Hsp33 family molecular chaperone HslO, partial [Methyloligellaceae bacterium]